MYTVMYMYASTKDQTNGTQRINIQGQNVHIKDQSYGPMGSQCMYKRTILQGHEVPVCTKDQPYAQIEDQSYEYTMHVQLSNPMGCCM